MPSSVKNAFTGIQNAFKALKALKNAFKGLSKGLKKPQK